MRVLGYKNKNLSIKVYTFAVEKFGTWYNDLLKNKLATEDFVTKDGEEEVGQNVQAALFSKCFVIPID